MTTFAEARTALVLGTVRSERLTALSDGGAPVAGWSTNAPQRIQVDHDSQVLVDESVIRAALAGMVDLDELASMDEDWCDAFAAWFGEERIAAIAAVWDVPLGATSPPVSIGIGTVVLQSTATGTPYFSSIDNPAVTLNSTGTSRFECRTAGTVGNVAAGTISKIITAPAGVTIDDTPEQVTSGRDRETNAELIARCLGKWATLGAGWTLDAFDYLIPTASATVTRWRVRDDNPFGPGTVGVVLANASGSAEVAEVLAVDEALTSRSVKPLGSGAVTVAAAAEDALSITITVVGDGTNADLQTDIETALDNLCNAMPLGPATLNDAIFQAVALGAAFDSIPVDIGSTTETITPDLPGFSGAVRIDSIDLVAPHDIPTDEVLVATITVTVA